MWQNFFDNIYLINLPEQTERRAISEHALYNLGVKYEVFPAIKNEEGWVGLILTMKKLFIQAIERGEENIIVLEDDFKFLMNFNDFMELLVLQIPVDYHCIYLGVNLLTHPSRFSENLLRIDAAYCSHAICYSISAMKLILEQLHRRLQYDIILMKHLQSHGHCYCTWPMLATQWPGYSDIQKEHTDWEKHMAMTYRSHTLNIV